VPEQLYLVCSFDEHEHAVNAYVSYGSKAQGSSDKSCILNGHWKRQDTDANVAFQDMDDCLKVSETIKQIFFYFEPFRLL